MCKGDKLYEFCRKSETAKKRETIIAGEVAEILDVSRQAVSKWETGISDPSTSNLFALVKLFGVSVEELLNEVK